jgi:hypothetical protein
MKMALKVSDLPVRGMEKLAPRGALVPRIATRSRLRRSASAIAPAERVPAVAPVLSAVKARWWTTIAIIDGWRRHVVVMVRG